MPEIVVGIRELKTGLSSYLRQVKSGATVVITEHGRPVGQIVPVKSPLEEKLERMVDANLAAWSGQRLSASVAKVPLQGAKTVADLLLEDRE
jgi:prevent-host-death family protein